MNNKEQNFISAVIYVRNCQNIIKNFLANIASTLEENFLHSEIICVDDASSDDSVNIIRSFRNRTGTVNISLLSLNSFHGREAAMQGGVSLAIGDFVYEFDVPIEKINKEDILKIYNKALEGNDIVAAIGSKRRSSSSLFYKIINKSGNIPYHLDTEYFRLISRRAINRVGSLNKVIAYRKIAYASSGLKYAAIEMDYELCPNTQGDNRYRRNLAINSLIIFTDVGFRFSIFMTFAMMAAMIVVAIYALVSRFAFNTLPGWTSTVLIMTFGFFGLFGILSVITKYLQLLMDINVRKTAFTFESIEKITRDGK